jgi:hypothetical protein
MAFNGYFLNSFRTIFLIILFQQVVIAQPEYARRIVDTLASSTFQGRGYTAGGMEKSAKFIRQEFIKHNLQPLGDDYFQELTVPVNTFPGRMMLKNGSKILNPGTDYLVEPCSPSAKGQFRLSNIVGKQLGRSFILLDQDTLKNAIEYTRKLLADENSPAGAILVTDKKLTWYLSQNSCEKPLFIVKRSALIQNRGNIGIDLKSEFFPSFPVNNVAGMIQGSKYPDSLIVLTAHYDHLGQMGSATYFPGANDNASGTAMLLSLARYFSKNPGDYTMIFLATAAEELGLFGSRFMVENPLFDLKKVKLLINFDLAGTGEEGITVVNGSVYPEIFNKLVEINNKGNYLSDIKSRGEACNSDHCFFHLAGVPSIYSYTRGGIQAYHDVYDRAETLPMSEFQDYQDLMIEFIQSLGKK